MNDISLKKLPEASQKTLRRARHIAPVPLKHHLGPHMARQESQKEEEIRENSSNLRAHLAKADLARLLQANEAKQKPPESADQLPETSR